MQAVIASAEVPLRVRSCVIASVPAAARGRHRSAAPDGDRPGRNNGAATGCAYTDCAFAQVFAIYPKHAEKLWVIASDE